MSAFDEYAEWLRIPAGRRPPSHYELLGLTEFESDSEIIYQAAMERMGIVRRYHLGEHGAEAVRLQTEISRALDCLKDAHEKRLYDLGLRAPIEPLHAPVPNSVGAPQPRTSLSSLTRGTETSPVARPQTKGDKGPSRRSSGGLVVGLAFGVLALLIGFWAFVIFRVPTSEGTLVVQVNEPEPELYVDGEEVTVLWQNGGVKAEVAVKPGTRKIELRKNGFRGFGEEVPLENRGRTVLVARLEPNAAKPPPEVASAVDVSQRVTDKKGDSARPSSAGMAQDNPSSDSDVPALSESATSPASATPAIDPSIALAPAASDLSITLAPTASDRSITLSVVNLMSSEHLTRHRLDDENSQRTLEGFIKLLDPAKVYFYQSDVDSFMGYRNELGCTRPTIRNSWKCT